MKNRIFIVVFLIILTSSLRINAIGTNLNLSEYKFSLKQRKAIEKNVLAYYKDYYPKFFKSLFKDSNPPDSLMPIDRNFKVFKVEIDSIPFELEASGNEVLYLSGKVLKVNKNFDLLNFNVTIHYSCCSSTYKFDPKYEINNFTTKVKLAFKKKDGKFYCISGLFRKETPIRKVLKFNDELPKNDSTKRLFYAYLLRQKIWIPTSELLPVKEILIFDLWPNIYDFKNSRLIDTSFATFLISGYPKDNFYHEDYIIKPWFELKHGYYPFHFQNKISATILGITRIEVTFDFRSKEKITFKAKVIHNVKSNKMTYIQTGTEYKKQQK
jgi:hypothetical protein